MLQIQRFLLAAQKPFMTGHQSSANPDLDVDENFRNSDLTVSFAAAQFRLSSAYCSKLFREQYGIRLFDYIQRRRLEAAKALLDSDKNLKDIAEEVGFSSALTMSRAFKRYEGTTPGRLRDLDNS